MSPIKKNITIPKSVTSIEFRVFDDCSDLTTITINNPKCNIDDCNLTINNGHDANVNGYYNGVICGYKGSTAQVYADKYGYTFKEIDTIAD